MVTLHFTEPLKGTISLFTRCFVEQGLSRGYEVQHMRYRNGTFAPDSASPSVKQGYGYLASKFCCDTHYISVQKELQNPQECLLINLDKPLTFPGSPMLTIWIFV